MTVLPRYQEARVVRSRCATCAHPVRSGRSTCASCAQPVRNLGAACAASAQPMRDLHAQVATDSPRKTSWWTLDWPVGSSNHTPSFRANITPMLVRCTTLILLVHIPFACTPVHTDTHGSLYYSSGPPGSRVTSSSVSTVHTQRFWDTIRVTAPLGAVCSHMSHTPSSDVSILRSPGDDSEDFAPSPAQAVPAPGTSAVGTPVGGLLSRVLRRGNYAPEILHVVEHIPDPVRSDATKGQADSGDADTSTAAPGTAATAPVGVPKSATPIHHVPDRHSQVDWADHEVFHFDPEIHRISGVPGALQAGWLKTEERRRTGEARSKGSCACVDLSGFKGEPAASSSTVDMELRLAPPPNLLKEGSVEEAEHRLVPTAPTGEPSQQVRAKEKWAQVADLEGHYTSQHGPFHDLRDALQRDKVCGPFGEPLPLAPVGNWILALGVSLLGLDSPDGQELFSRIANHQTAGDLVEAWSLQLWERGYRSLCEQLSGYFLLLHNVLTDIPPRFYTALGQEWRITWTEFKNVMRAWLGDSPARHCLPSIKYLRQVLSRAILGDFRPLDIELLRDLPREREVTAVVGRGSAPPNVQALPATGSGTRPAERSRPGDVDTKHGPRIRAMSWNVGGLSQEAWLEVQIWLHEQEEHDVILLQETHWRFTSSWSLPRYHIFHSGATDHRFQGCMIVISKSITSFESVRWSAPLVGHLLHVRFPVKGRHVDVINLYQYALHTGPDRAAVLHKRERVLHHLDKTLSSLPIRNVLLVGGDFNSRGTRDSMPFGPGTYLGPNPHPDRQLLANLANLNTWGRVSKAATFENDQARSQIDFFFARTAQIDGRSRRACTDPLFHLLRWRGGARHYPLQVSIPAVHYQSPAKVPDASTARAPKYQLTQPPERIQAFCEHLASTLSAPRDPSDLDRALQQAAAEHLLPVQPRAHGDSIAARVTGMVKQMWNLKHTAQQFALEVLRPFTIVAQIRHWRGTGERLWFSLGQLLSAWRHQAAYLRQHRHLRRRGRQAKKELMEEQLQQAWEADRQGDKSSIWKVVNRLAPRTARVKIQLRGSQGGLLTPVEEAERFRTICEKIYKLPPQQHSDTMVTPPPVPTPSPPVEVTPVYSLDHPSAVTPPDYALGKLPAHEPTPGPIQVPRLTEALSLLPARKATPPHLAQLHLWHLGKEVLLPHLATFCQRLWRSPHQFHQLWADAWIAWLAKPGKAPDQPENLRPISLTEGGDVVLATVRL
ncbi:unnamed protein product, partial [Symbiodinium necroappetens]